MRETFQERVDNEYWIDAKGRVVKYKGPKPEIIDEGTPYAFEDDQIVSLHYEIAKAEFPDLEYPDDYVEKKLGWIKVGCFAYGCPIIRKEPTQKQIDTLFDLGLLDKLQVDRGGPRFEKFQ